MPISEGLYQAVSAGLHSEPAAAELIKLLRTIDVVAGAAEAGNALVLDSSGGIATITTATITTLTNNEIITDVVTGRSGVGLTIDVPADILGIGTSTATAIYLGRSGQEAQIRSNITTTVGNGVIVTDKCTAVEGGDGVLHKTTLTFTLTGAHDLDMADDDHGTGIKVYDFPAGSIQILGATCNAIATSVNTGAGGGTFPMALGSEVGADDNTLTGTEADIIPSTAITGGTGSTASDFHATLAAPILFANAGGADLDLYVNAAITAAVAEGAVTIAVTGTATITWINLGDY